MISDLKSKALKGFFWSGYQKAGSMTISFITNLILARLLTPADFGCIGMILVFVNLSSVLIDAGFGSALIQRKDITETDFSTIFIWNVLVGCLLYGILYLLAPYIADFYKIHKLSSYLRALGVVLIFNSFSIIQTTILKKKLEFKILANSFILASIVALGVTLWMAFNGYNVWSLVVFQLIQSGLNSIFLWFSTKWRPIYIWSFNSFKKLFSFGGYLLMSTFIGTISKQLQSLLIGKLCSTSTLGYYTQARNLEQAPTNVIFSVIGQVVFPIFSANQNNQEEFNLIFKKIFNGIAYIVFPIMGVLIIIAKPLFIFLFTNKWMASVIYFQLLCIAGMIMPLIDVAIFAISALGHSRIIFKWSLINNVICILILLLGAFWSIYGIICGYIFYCIIAYFNYSLQLRRYCAIPLNVQFTELALLWILCFILIALIGFVNYFYSPTNLFILVEAITFISIYITITYLFKLTSAITCINLIKIGFKNLKLKLSKN